MVKTDRYQLSPAGEWVGKYGPIDPLTQYIKAGGK
jgi:hypothetical protein